MNKINLNLNPATKNIVVNGKDVKIPKLGLKHRMIVKDGMSHEDCMRELHKLICPNLSMAEKDIVSLHILEYNGKLKQTVNVDGFEYNLDNVEICQKLKFEYNGLEFKFRSPNMDLMKGPLDILLKECCVYVKKDGKKIDVPDFMDMPAFVYKWAKQITDTISISGPKGEIKNIQNIVELFSG